MIDKVGSVVKIAATALEAPVNLEIEQIIEPKKEGSIYFRARAISAGDQGPKGVKWNFNGNMDYFAKKQLLKAYNTFPGRNLFLNHDTSNPLKAVGRVLDAYPVEDPQSGEFYIECLSRIDKNLHPELAAMILNGDLNSVSMGASCGSSMCSICGTTIHSDQDQKCAHFNRLGQEFEAEVDMPEYSIAKGERVPSFCINSDLTFSELSIVSVPADSAALIKTVIAAFSNRITKTAAKNDTNSIVAELDTLLGLLTPADREAVKNQICSSVGSCKVATEVTNEGGFKVGDEVEINNKPEWNSTDIKAISKDGDMVMLKWEEDGENFWVPVHNITMANKKIDLSKKADMLKTAAAYDVLVYALNLSEEDKALASLDLFNAMVEAGFSTGRTKDGKAERQVFYTALHTAINKGWVKQVENGVYSLTEAGESRAKELGEWLGEDVVPGHGKLGPKEEKALEKKPEEKATPAEEKASEAAPEAPSSTEEAKEEVKPESPKEELAPEEGHENVFARKAVDSILNKLSGLEYERLQDHMTQKMKAKDNPMDNLKAEVTSKVTKVAEVPANLKPHEEGMPEAKPDMDKAEDTKAESPKEEAQEAAHEAKEVKEEKDEIQKLDEASKLIKEVKKEIKEQMGDDLAQEAKESGKEEKPKPEASEQKEPLLVHLSSKEPALTAKFNKQPFLSRSSWTVFSGDKAIITATLRDICGDHLKEMRVLVTSKEYGDRLIARINTDGLDKIAALLGTKIKVHAAKELEPHAEIKTSYEAGEHLVAKIDEKAVEKKAGACPCGKAECPCDCMLGKECSCNMAMASKNTEVKVEGSKESPATLTEAEKPRTEPEGAQAGQHWDKNKNMFSSDKTESDEAKAKEVGKEAKLEKGEMTLSEAEKPQAHPTGGIKPELMKPESDTAKAKDIGEEGAVAKLKNSSDSIDTTYEAGKAGKEARAKLESGELTLDKAEKPAAPDAFKPKMGTESSVLSDEAKAKEVGREAALNKQIEDATKKLAGLEAELNQKATELAQEKMERSIEAKMIKCRKLVEEMVRKDLLAESQDTVDKYLKQGQNLLDARKSAIRETVDLQLASFMQMPDSLLKVQAETITRMKKTAAPTSDRLRIPVQGQFNMDAGEADWLQNLPWS